MWAWARALCVVAAVVCAPLAPPEHVHEAEDHDHHEHSVAHRHDHVHGAGVDDAVHPHGAGAVFDDDDHDGHAVFVDQTGSQGPQRAAVPLPSAVLLQVLDTPVLPRRAGVPLFVERLIHGPPSPPASLRAPPASQSI